MKKNKFTFGKILFALIIVFFYLPIVYMIVFSFNEGKSLTSFSGFSFKWYQQMWESRDMMQALYTTFSIAILATVISTVVGTIAAIGISKSRKIVRSFVEQVNNLPIMNPDIVTAIGLMLLFITFQVEKGYLTMLLAHIAFCIPFVMLSVMPKIRSLDPNLADAAMDLGATPWQALVKVIVPQITPGIVSGALIAFTMSVDDFIISYFVTGSGVKNLSTMVYTMARRINPSVNAVSTLVVVFIFLALIIINIVSAINSKRQKKAELSARRRRSGIFSFRFAISAIAIVLVVAFLMVGMSGTGGGRSDLPYSGQELYIYLPGEYLDETLLDTFEEQTGARVIVDNFESNEQMYIKVAAGGNDYDLLIPSDYMIERLIQEDLLQKLDPSKINCMPDVVDSIKGMPYDPTNEYSVPYFWGTVGIVYDTTQVDYEDLERDGFAIFLNTKYRGNIYLYDSERDSFMMALKSLGYSMNTDSDEELGHAFDWLIQCVETMRPEIVTDEIIDNMAQGRKALGLIYSGDAVYVMCENENMDFFMPNEGTNQWVDAMVIPKHAGNPELAHEFINFITSYEPALANSSYVGYTSPNAKVMETLSGPGGDYEGINAYIPRTDNSNDEAFCYNDRTRKIMSEKWSKVKIAASNAN